MLAALTGVVAALSYDEPGSHGRVSMRSSRGSRYEFTWLATPERLLLGGTRTPDLPGRRGRPVPGLRGLPRWRDPLSEELIARWFALVKLCSTPAASGAAV